MEISEVQPSPADGAGSRSPVTINIGGEKLIAVSADLFDILGENKISSMLSGRWEPVRDADGNIFVDYSPEVFMPLVEWLRHRRDASPRSEIKVRLSSEYQDQWIRMMRSYSVNLKQLARAGISKETLLRFDFPAEEVHACFREELRARCTWRAHPRQHRAPADPMAEFG